MQRPSAKKSKHGHDFCSRACHYKGRGMGLVKRVVTTPYTYTEESKARLREASSKPKGQRAFHPTLCLHCGKTFDDPNDGRRRKSGLTFCSLACCNSYRKGDKSPDWRPLQRAVRERDEYTCQRCGTKPDGRDPDVHHIRPVSSFENVNDANTPENLVTLCHPCHMYVEWNGMDFTWPR